MSTFWKQHSWKQKNKWLRWGGLLFLFLVYQLSIKKTLETRAQYLEQERTQSGASQKQEELARLKDQLRGLGAGMAAGEGKNLSGEVDVLNLVATAAAHQEVMVKEIPAKQTVRAGELQVHYHVYCLQGEYAQLLRCWYELEQEGLLNLVNISFRKENNPANRQPELNMYLSTAQLAQEPGAGTDGK